MVRIAGINLLNNQYIKYALTSIYGIGLTTSENILKKVQINIFTHVKNLKDDEIMKLRVIIEKNYKIEEDLRRIIKKNINHLSEINCFKGNRHKLSLPLRGQRTRTNSRTRRLKKIKKK